MLKQAKQASKQAEVMLWDSQMTGHFSDQQTSKKGVHPLLLLLLLCVWVSEWVKVTQKWNGNLSSSSSVEAEEVWALIKNEISCLISKLCQPKGATTSGYTLTLLSIT